MSRRKLFMVTVLLATAVGITSGVIIAQSPEDSNTAFTYQGFLEDANGPINRQCTFIFSLFDQSEGGSALLPGALLPNVPVTNGSFSSTLDFGADSFDGGERYLDISLDCGNGFAALTPRQRITSVPQAVYAQRVHWDNILGVPADLVSGGEVPAYTAAANSGLSLDCFCEFSV